MKTPFFGMLLTLWCASVSLWAQPRNLVNAPAKWPTLSAQIYRREIGVFQEEVAALQYLLREKGVYKGRADGIFGPQTSRAVRSFQRAKGLKVDGVVGAKTWARLVRPLKRGSKGDAVRALQILIRPAMGHNGEQENLGLEADGIFGRETENAVLWAKACENQFNQVMRDTSAVSARDWAILLGGRVAGQQI